MRFSRIAYVSAIVCIVLGCTDSSAPQGEAEFRHDVSGQVLPWTNEDFDVEEGKFTFAVFSDLTGGERDGVFDVAVEQLRLLRPELIVSVGDLIEGGDLDDKRLNQQWDTFDQSARHCSVQQVP